MRPVFVGGTGRSGTTILAKVIGAHPAFHAFPRELRFLTDPDGLTSLRFSLVEQWSPFHADMALLRFRRLMRALKTRFIGRYPTTGLAELFGREHYQQSIDRYLAKLCAFEYRGAWAGRTTVFGKALLRLFPRSREWTFGGLPRLSYAKPFSADEFATVSREFIQELVAPTLNAARATDFVEHTPGNAVHADLLLQLFPDARIVVIARDPRDVVSSMRGKDWGPARPAQVQRIVEDATNRWNQLKRVLPPHSWMELQFEDFIGNRGHVLRNVCAFLGVALDPAMLAVDVSQANIGRWHRDPKMTRVAP